MPKHIQVLYSDKFYVNEICFMLGQAKPLNLILVQHLVVESHSHLANCFQEFIGILLSHKFETGTIFSDADQAVISQINDHGNIVVETCGAGDHVNEAESSIKTIKERFRSVKAGLNFPLFKKLIVELVHYVVGRLNLSISQFATDGLCARVRLTGVLVDARKEMNIGFGHLVVSRNKNVVYKCVAKCVLVSDLLAIAKVRGGY